MLQIVIHYNYNRNYPAVLQILFAVSGSSKFGNAICSSITLLFPYGHSALCRVAVKEVEILRQSVNTEALS
jgi:hypothetical protein